MVQWKDAEMHYENNSSTLNSIYYVPGIVLTLLTHFLLMTALRSRYFYYAHFTDEEIGRLSNSAKAP